MYHFICVHTLLCLYFPKTDNNLNKVKGWGFTWHPWRGIRYSRNWYCRSHPISSCLFTFPLRRDIWRFHNPSWGPFAHKQSFCMFSFISIHHKGVCSSVFDSLLVWLYLLCGVHYMNQLFISYKISAIPLTRVDVGMKSYQDPGREKMFHLHNYILIKDFKIIIIIIHR